MEHVIVIFGTLIALNIGLGTVVSEPFKANSLVPEGIVEIEPVQQTMYEGGNAESARAIEQQ